MAKAKDLVTRIVLHGKTDKSLSKAFKNASSHSEQVAKTFSKLPGVMKGASIAAGAAITAVSVQGVKSAIEYQTGLAKISTIADENAMSMEQMSKSIKELSAETGVATSELTEAVYEAISSGVDTAGAVELVGTASKLAKAGFTDAQTAIDGLTTVMNTYGIETEKAAELSGQMMVTQNLGKVTVGELAGTIGRLAPIAHSAGVSTEEMFSSLSVLTANGIQCSEAVSGMKAALSGVVKPTAQASKMAEALGLDFSSTALQTKGLGGFLEDVKNKTGGNLDVMAQLFGSVEALNAVLTLTSDTGVPLFNESMAQMGDGASVLQEGFEKMADTPAARLEKLNNKMELIKLNIGEKLLPVVEDIMERVEGIDFDKVSDSIIEGLDWISEHGKTVIDVAGAMTTGFVVFKTIATFGGIISGIKGMMVAMEGATWAQKMLNLVMSLNPFMIVAVAIGAVAGALYLAYQKSETFRNICNELWTTVKDVFGKIADWIEEKINFAKGIIEGISDTLSWFGEKLGLVKKGTEDATSAASEALEKTGGGEEPPKHGTGGYFDKPHVAVIGDKPETIVPEGNTPRNRGLLKRAAEGVGASLGNTYNFTFAPVVNGGNADENRRMLQEEEEEFERKMDAYFAKKGRMSYA